MKNKAFSKLSIPEKEAKISSVLDSKTDGLLYAAELQRIAEALPLRQQYTVKLYRSNRRFQSFKPSTPELYRKSLQEMVNTVLPAWIAYRTSYINTEEVFS